MGFKDLFKSYREDDNYDQDGYSDEYGNGYNQENEEEAAPETDEYAPEPAQSPVNISGNAIELRVVRPESFKNVDQIADHLLSRRTVVLNLETAGKDTAKRLIDFLSGVAYAIKGDIRKVSNNTYVINPGNVTVSGDALGEAVAADTDASAESGRN